MARRAGVYLLGILLIGLLARILLFDVVVVNSDDGMWMYDAWQVTEGRIPIVDFPSRSPLYHIILGTLVVEPFGRSIAAFRSFQIAVGVLVTILVFALGRTIADDRVALASAALYWWSGATIAYGMQIKSEPLTSAVVLGAILCLIGALEHPRVPRLPAFAAIGVVLGVTVLIRMSIVVPVGAIGLYLLYRRELVAAVTIGFSWLVGMTAAYVSIAGSATMAVRMADAHIIDLVASRGFGGVQWVGFDGLGQTVNDAGGPVYRMVLNLDALVGITLSTLLVVPLMFVWASSYLDSFGLEDLPMAVLAWIGLVVFGVGAVYDQPLRAAGGITLLLVTVLAWHLDPPRFEDLKRPYVGLLWWVFGVFLFSYLLRNRILYQHYALDLLPLIAIPAAIAAVEVIDRNDLTVRKFAAPVSAILLCSLLLTVPVVAGMSGAYYTPSDVERFGAHVTGHTESGDTILTAQPLYVVNADPDRYVAGNFSRGFYIIREADGPVATEFADDYLWEICRSDLSIQDTNIMLVAEQIDGFDDELQQCHDPIDGPPGTLNTTQFHKHK